MTGYRPAITVSSLAATGYAAFFNFAQRALCAAAIFLRADADMVGLTGADLAVVY